jgi:hypothetical protein
MFVVTLSQRFNRHNTHFFGRVRLLRAGLFKDLIVYRPDCLRPSMFKGLIVNGSDCAESACAELDSVGPDGSCTVLYLVYVNLPPRG